MSFYECDVDVLIDEAALQTRVRELGAQITRDYAGKELTLVGIMKGSIFFLADLARAIDIPLVMELMGVSSYYGGVKSSGDVRISFDARTSMQGRHLLVVEDIIDTGLTLQFLVENLKARQPASLKVCALIEKPAFGRLRTPADYLGFSIDDRFVVGYGLDHAEKYRNLPVVGMLRS